MTMRINTTSCYGRPHVLVPACLPDRPRRPPLSLTFTTFYSGLTGLCLSRTQSRRPPQGLCTCPLCLEFSSPESLVDQVSAQMSSHRLAQISTEKPPILWAASIQLHCFLIFFSPNADHSLKLLMCLFTCLWSVSPPLDCKLHEFRVFAMFTAVSPVPRTVPGT